ncbi:HAD family hydrolase [Yinghuangia seranimata]|uniref:HAD family hydrolase n=1 Tax=Yinghuangia seranimata TaxID=408067 RepID=UPI00248AA571|nr:HAD family hydrolase [Yinghuangia seranimata]MDI2126826.1 HAD family hydrolase [Yinghuangia seranimata]
MTQPPLIVCDLDGTLLRPDATASGYTRDVLNRLIAAGIPTTIATARGLPSIRALLPDVELALPVIELGGSYVSDPATGRHLSHHTLDRGLAARVVDHLLTAGIEPSLTAWDGETDTVAYGDLTTPGTRWFYEEKRDLGDPRLRYCADFRALTAEQRIALIRVSVPDADAESFAKTLDTLCRGQASIVSMSNGYCPGQTEFGVHSPTADKGAAVRDLRERVGHTGELLVCGDHLNDLAMFALADRRVAPSSAHPDVLALATDVTGPNDEDGVARFLEREFLA